ncbi:HU domain-containing protein [Pedobacter africanus]|uniref:Sporulation related domain-containing protein n=1 Tax=Pedobacter africanus TaxID=151894 RepID=A0A1W2DSA8_9SPHI|nr:SPOR domain-containing protein [Pedobacter africanus]SMD00415.1 Sporulation related domain-containing protein [Pedobacter africanus]
MDILSYLSTLIKNHKEVGIPGLGTIYKRKSPGRYDTETHSFLPPSYTLSFTSDLKEQELLTDLISKKRNISKDAANYFVEQFSENILDELSNQQESDFGDLGTFSTSTGSITFIPKQEQNFGFDFYGLPPLKEDLVSNIETKTEKEPLIVSDASTENELVAEGKNLTIEDEPQLSQEQLELENNNADLRDGVEEIDDLLIAHLDSTEDPGINEPIKEDEQEVYEEIAEVSAPVQDPVVRQVPVIETPEGLTEEESAPAAATSSFTLDYTEENKTGMPVYLKVLLALLTVAAIAGITYALKPELFTGAAVIKEKTPNQDIVQTIKQNDQHKLDSIAQADSIRKSNEKAILAADSVKDSLTTAKAVERPSGNIVSYDIIAASLLNKREADRFLSDMKQRGIPATIAKMPGKRIKISIGSFADMETANKQLEILKKSTKIPGIYVTPIRHTNNPK